MLFQLSPDVNDKVLHLWGNLVGVQSRSLGMIPIPIGLSRLIAAEPFKEPSLGSSHFTINRDRIFLLQILLDGHLSQDLFFHRITSMVDLAKNILYQFQPQGNRCADTKIDIKGNLSADTFGLPMR
jgi:hypothetical protein